ncbi:hypothetical protein M885DRAFT_611204 [Pelagophyceae sp. CCMP2097]|nr:hypothetical protein M885DRAFT_611204 [Pelagophyceae sp. CCMP2097]
MASTARYGATYRNAARPRPRAAAKKPVRKVKKQPEWNSYLTDSARYRLNDQELQRRRAAAAAKTALYRHVTHTASTHTASAPLQRKRRARAPAPTHLRDHTTHHRDTARAPSGDASELIFARTSELHFDGDGDVHLSTPSYKRQAAAGFSDRVRQALHRRESKRPTAPRSSESVESLTLRVWQLEERLDDALSRDAAREKQLHALQSLVNMLQVSVDAGAGVKTAAWAAPTKAADAPAKADAPTARRDYFDTPAGKPSAAAPASTATAPVQAPADYGDVLAETAVVTRRFDRAHDDDGFDRAHDDDAGPAAPRFDPDDYVVERCVFERPDDDDALHRRHVEEAQGEARGSTQRFDGFSETPDRAASPLPPRAATSPSLAASLEGRTPTSARAASPAAYSSSPRVGAAPRGPAASPARFSDDASRASVERSSTMRAAMHALDACGAAPRFDARADDSRGGDDSDDDSVHGESVARTQPPRPLCADQCGAAAPPPPPRVIVASSLPPHHAPPPPMNNTILPSAVMTTRGKPAALGQWRAPRGGGTATTHLW